MTGLNSRGVSVDRPGIGDYVTVRASAIVGRITGDNGHAYKVLGAWFHEDEVTVVDSALGVDDSTSGVDHWQMLKKLVRHKSFRIADDEHTRLSQVSHDLPMLSAEAEWDGMDVHREHALPSDAASSPQEPPRKRAKTMKSLKSDRPLKRSLTEEFRIRMIRAMPCNCSKPASIEWLRLVAVQCTESTRKHESSQQQEAVSLNINSGGQVFFAILAGSNDAHAEVIVVLKFVEPHWALLSEQLAAELARDFNLASPTSCVYLKRHHKEEWTRLTKAAIPLCSVLSNALEHYDAMLVIEFVHGNCIEDTTKPWDDDKLSSSTQALGSLLVLDMLMGNRDRLPVGMLGWRGNSGNILWDVAGICNPIDAAVTCRPEGLLRNEDDEVRHTLNMILEEQSSAHKVLVEILSCNPIATAKLRSYVGAGCPGIAANRAVQAFQEGVKSGLQCLLREMEMLQTIEEQISQWLAEFQKDEVLAQYVPNLPPWESSWPIFRKRLQTCQRQEVKHRIVLLQKKLLHKSDVFLQSASAGGMRTKLTFSGFLGEGTLSPLTALRELVVRMRQLISRADVMLKVWANLSCVDSHSRSTRKRKRSTLS